MAELRSVPWAALIPVGPDAVEVDRVRDGLDALHLLEPGARRIILVDDSPVRSREAELLEAAGPHAPRTTVVANPRSPQAEGWSEGVLVGVETGLRTLMQGPPVEWVLKMDTDALVIGAFADAVS